MKKTIVALGIITSAIVACGPKASKTQTPAVTVASAEAGGQLISSAKCTKCHKDQTGHVARHTFGEQEDLFKSMAGKAKLSDQETADLIAYVKAHSKSE